MADYSPLGGTTKANNSIRKHLKLYCSEKGLSVDVFDSLKVIAPAWLIDILQFLETKHTSAASHSEAAADADDNSDSSDSSGDTSEAEAAQRATVAPTRPLRVHRCPDGQYTKAVYRQLLRCAATTGPASSLVFVFGCAASDAQYSEQHSEDSFYSDLLATLEQPHDNTSALKDTYLQHMKARLPHLHKLLIEVQFTSAKGTACIVPDWLAGYIKVLSSIYSKFRQQVTVNCSVSSSTCSSGELPADSNTPGNLNGAAVSLKQCAVLPARS
eukprot:4465-Heterococcus_DN1.PRE.1